MKQLLWATTKIISFKTKLLRYFIKISYTILSRIFYEIKSVLILEQNSSFTTKVVGHTLENTWIRPEDFEDYKRLNLIPMKLQVLYERRPW